mgnify:FL=1|tara:strand:+ start:307 stop:495 length:189 start_codon:yes stop_codon:yes gene_type:complete
MIYLYINKQTNELKAYGSLVALCSATGLKKDRFYTHFGRNENKEFENEEIRIVKTEIVRSTN